MATREMTHKDYYFKTCENYQETVSLVVDSVCKEEKRERERERQLDSNVAKGANCAGIMYDKHMQWRSSFTCMKI
jgi:hypothetical protein